MSTLFGRNKKNRPRTISTGEDSLETRGVPYASTSTPGAPPVPRQSISNDGAPLSVQRSRASELSMSSSARPLSPPLRDITPPVNLIPEHMPWQDTSGSNYSNNYNNATASSSSHSKQYSTTSRSSQHSSSSGKRSKTPDLSHDRLQRYPSTSTDGGSSSHHQHATTLRSSIQGTTPAHKRHLDRLTQGSRDSQDGANLQRQRSATSMTAGSSAQPSSDSIAREFTPRANSRSGHYSESYGTRSTNASSSARETVSSNASRTESLIPPYSPTMRSIGNSSGQFSHYPYGSIQEDATTNQNQQHQHQHHNSNLRASQASQASTHSIISQRSSTSLNSSRIGPPTPSLGATEFFFPRPSSDDDIEGMFEDLLLRTDVPVRDRDGMRAWAVTKKWTMVYNDKLQDWKQTRKTTKSDRTTPQLQSTSTFESTPTADQPPIFTTPATPDPNSKMRLQRGKTESPEWYLTKFMDGSIQPAIVSSLTVGLRTYEISWVETFVNKLHGLSVLTNALANISRLPVPRKEHDIKLELEIVKCLKHLLQMQVRRFARTTVLQRSRLTYIPTDGS